MNTENSKILIIDDHAMFLDGITEILNNSSKYEIVASVNNGQKALEILRTQHVDLVISDLRMENMSGLDITKIISSDFKQVKILIVSMHNDPFIVSDLLKLGVTGYILKSSGKQELFAAIESVLSGKTYFSPEVESSFINSKVLSKNLTNKTISLTRREKEVLKLIAEEKTTNEISEQLFISLNTVETHRKNILKKFDVRNSVGIVKRAMELGLLE